MKRHNFEVVNGEITTKQESRNSYFECSEEGLISFKNFPDIVNGDLYASKNKFKTLAGCPNTYSNCNNFYLSDNYDLEDISDMPSSIWAIQIMNCPNIKVFTKEITSKDGKLRFSFPTEEVAQRIKQWKYYEVVDEEIREVDGKDELIYIDVKPRTLGKFIIDSI